MEHPTESYHEPIISSPHLPLYFHMKDFHAILPSVSWSPKWSLKVSFVPVSYISHACYVTHQFYLPSSYYVSISSLSNFFWPHNLLVSNILLNILFSKTLNLCSFTNVIYKISNPCRTPGRENTLNGMVAGTACF